MVESSPQLPRLDREPYLLPDTAATGLGTRPPAPGVLRPPARGFLARNSSSLLLAYHGLDLLLAVAAITLAGLVQIRITPYVRLALGSNGLSYKVYGVILVVWIITFARNRVYSSKRTMSVVSEYVLLARTVALVTIVSGWTLFLLAPLGQTPGRAFYLSFVLVGFTATAALHGMVRFVQRWLRTRGRNVRRVVIVGTGSRAHALARQIQAHPSSGLAIAGFVSSTIGGECEEQDLDFPVLGSLEQIDDVLTLHAVGTVYLALRAEEYEATAWLSRHLQRYDIDVHLLPALEDVFLVMDRTETVWGLPYMTVRASSITGSDRLIKRLLDVTVTSLAFVVLSPLLAVIAVAIRIDSPGPIIFRQKRVGEGGHIFEMYKFRSMIHNAPALGIAAGPEGASSAQAHKQRQDHRVTRLGAVLRRYSLDELPQLVNILKGDMSLVGPRPELPRIVGQYESWQHARQVVPAGLTGWWQINGRSDLPLHMNTHLDLYYIRNYSIWLDLKILLFTIKAVFSSRGSF